MELSIEVLDLLILHPSKQLYGEETYQLQFPATAFPLLLQVNISPFKAAVTHYSPEKETLMQQTPNTSTIIPSSPPTPLAPSVRPQDPIQNAGLIMKEVNRSSWVGILQLQLRKYSLIYRHQYCLQSRG